MNTAGMVRSVRVRGLGWAMYCSWVKGQGLAGQEEQGSGADGRRRRRASRALSASASASASMQADEWLALPLQSSIGQQPGRRATFFQHMRHIQYDCKDARSRVGGKDTETRQDGVGSRAIAKQLGAKQRRAKQNKARQRSAEESKRTSAPSPSPSGIVAGAEEGASSEPSTSTRLYCMHRKRRVSGRRTYDHLFICSAPLGHADPRGWVACAWVGGKGGGERRAGRGKEAQPAPLLIINRTWRGDRRIAGRGRTDLLGGLELLIRP